MAHVAIADCTDRVAFIDPASGKTALKRTASRSADIVVAQDAQRRIFVLHAWAGRIPTTSHTDRIFKLVADFTPRVVGIDASAMQSLYADALMREARQRGLRFPLLPVKMTTDKDARIRAVLQPVIAEGRLFVQQAQRDLWQELEAFPSGLTCDLVDALASAIALLPARPDRQQRSDEKGRWVDYLRASGAPSFYVDEVLKTVA